MKKIIIAISTILAFASNLYAATLFSGEVGLAAELINEGTKSVDPALTFDSFFAGQFAIGKSLSIRGELSLQTEDTYDTGLFTETESKFRIDELSASYVTSFGGYSHTFSAFFGFFESIGTQQYIMRQLGTQKFSSLVTENYLGLNGPSAYAVYGFGGAYSIKFNNMPVSTGLSIYRNNECKDDTSQLNIDWRLAASYRYFTLDFLAGLGAPLYTKDENNDEVVLLIDTIYFHSGFDMLIGSRYSTSLFLQCGIDYLPVKSSSKASTVEAKDIYLLAEPRFTIADIKLNVTAYSIPEDAAEKSLLLDNTFGANLCLFSDALYTKNRDYTAGINWTVSFENKNFMDILDTDLIDSMDIKISPFANCNAMGGKLNMMLQASATKFANGKAGALKINIGYKKEL